MWRVLHPSTTLELSPASRFKKYTTTRVPCTYCITTHVHRQMETEFAELEMSLSAYPRPPETESAISRKELEPLQEQELVVVFQIDDGPEEYMLGILQFQEWFKRVTNRRGVNIRRFGVSQCLQAREVDGLWRTKKDSQLYFPSVTWRGILRSRIPVASLPPGTATDSSVFLHWSSTTGLSYAGPGFSPITGVILLHGCISTDKLGRFMVEWHW